MRSSPGTSTPNAAGDVPPCADTIAAIATPPGVAAVAIVRISGSDARAILRSSFAPRRAGGFAPGRLRRGAVVDPQSGQALDDALAVLFPAPHSYTGEDVVELHVHGGSGVAAAVLAQVLRAGARLAAAGEFTRRAFVNGRMDLAQAEAVGDLIAAQTQASAKAAALRLEGTLGRALRELRAELVDRLVEIEAHVDYPDEVPAPDSSALAQCVGVQLVRLEALLTGSGAARALRDGIDCVIVGPPNAGKSSLLNALLDAERAIVSDIPGTTRDIVEDWVAVDGVVLKLRDTAGLRTTSDVIEAQGVARARGAIERAELVILVIDGSRPLGADEREALELTNGAPRIVVCNKGDLGNAGLRELRSIPQAAASNGTAAFVAGSVLRAETVARVRAAIARLGWGGAAIGANASLVANGRQIDALTRARESLEQAQATIAAALPVDLLSGDFGAAIAAYGEVTGESVTAQVLEGIFSRFCVGK